MTSPESKSEVNAPGAAERQSGPGIPAQLAPFLDTLPLPVAELTEKGVITYFNAAACALFEVTEKEVAAGLNILDLAPPDERDIVADKFAKTAAGNARFGVELNIRRAKSGTVFPVTIWGQPSESDSGVVIRAAALDLTEMRGKDVMLEWLASFPEESPHPVFSSDRSGRLKYVNPTAFRLAKEMGMRGVEDLLPPEHRRLVADALGQFTSIDYIHSPADECYLAWSYRPISSGEEVHIYGRDVSRLIKTEEELREYNRKLTDSANQLEQSRNVLKQILESIPSRVFWKDRDTRYLGCNVLFANDGGQDRPEDLIGKTDYDMTWREQAELYRADDLEVMNSGCSKLNIIEPQTTPGGEVIWLRTSKVPLKSSSGEVWGVLGLYDDITDQKSAEEALRESEHRFRLLFESMQEGVAHCQLIYDDHGVSVDWLHLKANDAFMRITKTEDIVGKRISELLPTLVATNPELLEIYSRVAETGVAEEREYEFEAIGTSVHMSVSSPVRSQFVLVFEDITERKRFERELAESEERYRVFFESVDEGFCFATPDDVFTIANPAASRIFGVKNLVGRNLGEFLRSQERMAVGLQTSQRKRGVGSRYHLRIIRPDDQVRDIMVTASPRLDSKGAFLGSFGIFHDVTELKSIERALEQSAAELRLRDEINRILLIESDDQIYSDILSVVLRELDSSVGLFGYLDGAGSLVLASMTEGVWERSAMPNKTLVFPPEKWGGIWGRALREKRTLMENGNLHPPEGHISVHKALAVPLVHQGKLVGLFNVANRDQDYGEADAARLESIAEHVAPLLSARLQRVVYESEKQVLEDQLRQAQKMEAIGTLAGGIAHDFNNLLTPIMGYSDMMMRETPEGSPQREDLQFVISAATRARELVKQILMFSRQTEHDKIAVSLAPIIKETLKLLRSTIPANIEITCDVESTGGEVMADPSQIQQIIMNLVTNAALAMEERGGLLEVRLAEFTRSDETDGSHPALASGDYVLLVVTDNGCGMSEEVLSRIFEPFYTTRQVGKGTGLGLPVVHGIVKSLGGGIDVKSAPGAGTVFSVFLPKANRTDKAALPPESNVAGGGEHVLLVDDEPAIANICRRILERYGYRVTMRTSSAEALEAFEADKDRIDLVVSDQMMPQMTGDELARRIKKINPDVPVVLLTGYSSKITEQNYRDHGIDAMLLKPIISTEFAQLVRNMLDLRKLSRDA